MEGDRVQKAVELILRYGMIDGAHHKQWILDQVLRVLLADSYNDTIAQYNTDDDYAPWDAGIPP